MSKVDYLKAAVCFALIPLAGYLIHGFRGAGVGIVVGVFLFFLKDIVNELKSWDKEDDR